jgi:hypothetical protein
MDLGGRERHEHRLPAHRRRASRTVDHAVPLDQTGARVHPEDVAALATGTDEHLAPRRCGRAGERICPRPRQLPAPTDLARVGAQRRQGSVGCQHEQRLAFEGRADKDIAGEGPGPQGRAVPGAQRLHQPVVVVGDHGHEHLGVGDQGVGERAIDVTHPSPMQRRRDLSSAEAGVCRVDVIGGCGCRWAHTTARCRQYRHRHHGDQCSEQDNSPTPDRWPETSMPHRAPPQDGLTC